MLNAKWNRMNGEQRCICFTMCWKIEIESVWKYSAAQHQVNGILNQTFHHMLSTGFKIILSEQQTRCDILLKCLIFLRYIAILNEMSDYFKSMNTNDEKHDTNHVTFMRYVFYLNDFILFNKSNHFPIQIF